MSVEKDKDFEELMSVLEVRSDDINYRYDPAGLTPEQILTIIYHVRAMEDRIDKLEWKLSEKS